MTHNDFIAKYIGNAVLDAMSQNAEVDATVQIKVIMHVNNESK